MQHSAVSQTPDAILYDCTEDVITPETATHSYTASGSGVNLFLTNLRLCLQSSVGKTERHMVFTGVSRETQCRGSRGP